MLTLIKNAQVYTPEDRGLCDLLIGGGTIIWLGKSGDGPAPHPSMNTVDAAGARLIPGLIDGHAHLTGGGGESGFSSRVPAVGLSRFTQSGITSVVGLLGTDDTTRDTQSLLAETRSLREQGLNAYCYTGGYHVPPTTLTGSVRRDIVNIDPIIGVGEVAISDHRSSQPTLNELLRIASDAHVAGMMTNKAGILHLHLGDGKRGLSLINQALETAEIPARVYNPTHINRNKALFEEACALSKRGCFVDLTAFPVEEGEDAWSAEEGLMRYLSGGFDPNKITVSSDGGGCLPHFDADGRIARMDIGEPASLFNTLKTLLNQGQALTSVLPAFTSNVASLLRLDRKGQIQAGFDADLVLLDNDHAIHSVMIAGVWHRQNFKQIITGSFNS